MKERKEKLVAVRLPTSLRSVLFKEAERRGLTISHVVREAIELHVNVNRGNHGTYRPRKQQKSQ